MLARLLSWLFILYFIVSSIILSVVAVVLWAATVLFDPKLKALHVLSCFWAAIYVWPMPAWSITVKGKERMDPQGVYMMASNHQSMVDILAGFYLFVYFKWVAKAELFRVPFVGLVLRLNRHIPLKRDDRQSTVEMIRSAQENLEKGNSVFIFPEGTRSKRVGVKPFKAGAFAMARRSNTSILPIAIAGSREALPKHSLVIRGRHHITIEVLDPIPPSIFEEKSTAEVAELVRNRIAEAIGEPLVEEG